MTRVAIVIVTYNSALEIGECLDSPALNSDVEIVVVDNNSQDDTCEIVRARGVRLFRNSTNIGFAAAVNQGIRATGAKFVLLLNPDAHFLHGLECLIDRCSTAGTGAAGGMLIGPDGMPQTGFMARSLPSPLALIFEVLGINKLWPGNPVNWHYRCKGLNPMSAGLVEQPAGAFLMFPRSVWESLGGFDERYWPLWFEDVDFCARLKRAGLSVYYEPAAVAKHAGSHSIHSLSLENREKYWYGNLLEYAARHYRSIEFRTVCATVALGSILRAMWGFRRGGVKALVVYGNVARSAVRRVFVSRQS
ncbi:MAG TPA: glycosyltransferase family 2 protein [Bryobacteraceae bacterium]|nr:glycosyltransferase family 2 protein [Bryobacteraceae bacterium]